MRKNFAKKDFKKRETASGSNRDKKSFGEKKFFKKEKGEENGFREKRKSFSEKKHTGGFGKKKFFGKQKPFGNSKYKKKIYPDKIESFEEKPHSNETRLNKYIANAGICSRREADDLIAAGAVSVNGKIITEMGFKVKPGDIVNYGGQTLRQEKLRYVLLNKPKDYITTMDDPEGRKNVMELVRSACRERIYPVGRLDRTTTGVLLFTNDG